MSPSGKWTIGGLTVVLATAGALSVSNSWKMEMAAVKSMWTVDIPPAPHPAAPPSSPAPPISNVIFASPGRVEGLSDKIEIGAAQDGIIKSVYVEEGDLVRKGTLLAEIGCDDLKAGLQTASAEVDAAREAKVRLLRGTRVEERRVAAEKTRAARASFEQAKSRLEMMSSLYEKEEISREAYELAVRDMGVADADFEAALRTEELLAAPPLEEEEARAEAEIVAAEGRVRELQEHIRKCSIFAPTDATVLRVYARPGEPFSTVTPRSLFTLANASGRRVRAEIDERDIYKVSLGQPVAVEAEALEGKWLTGFVERISVMMGRKTILTGDPADKSDRDILEAVIRLENDPTPLPIGLRVTVRFLASQSGQSN